MGGRVLREEWKQRLLPLRGAAVERRTVWIFGSPRSGSTWLARMLTSVPGLGLMNEPLLGHYLTPFLADLPAFDPDVVDPQISSIRHVRRDDAGQFFDASSEDVWLPHLRRMINARLGRRLAQMPASELRRARLIVKDPNSSEGADLIMRAQPRAGLVFLYRDALDVIASELAANLRGAWVSETFPGAVGIESRSERLEFVRLAAHKWNVRTLAVRDAYESHTGPKFFVRYGDLRSDPVTVLHALNRSLSLDLATEAIESVVRRFDLSAMPKSMVGEHRFVRSGRVGGFADSLGDEEQILATAATAVTRELMESDPR